MVVGPNGALLSQFQVAPGLYALEDYQIKAAKAALGSFVSDKTPFTDMIDSMNPVVHMPMNDDAGTSTFVNRGSLAINGTVTTDPGATQRAQPSILPNGEGQCYTMRGVGSDRVTLNGSAANMNTILGGTAPYTALAWIRPHYNYIPGPHFVTAADLTGWTIGLGDTLTWNGASGHLTPTSLNAVTDGSLAGEGALSPTFPISATAGLTYWGYAWVRDNIGGADMQIHLIEKDAGGAIIQNVFGSVAGGGRKTLQRGQWTLLSFPITTTTGTQAQMRIRCAVQQASNVDIADLEFTEDPVTTPVAATRGGIAGSLDGTLLLYQQNAGDFQTYRYGTSNGTSKTSLSGYRTPGLGTFVVARFDGTNWDMATNNNWTTKTAPGSQGATVGTAAQADLTLGAYPAGTTPYRGDIQNFALFNRALTDDEVETLWRASN